MRHGCSFVTDCNITKVLKTQSDLDSIRADCKKIVGSLDIQCADDDQINNFEVRARLHDSVL